MKVRYTHIRTIQSPYLLVSVIHARTLSISICCSFPLCHYSCSQLYCHIHSLPVSVFLPVSLHLNFSVFLPVITSHLWGPLLRRASHLSPRCDNRYRWHSLLGRSPINTCTALSLSSFLPLFHLCPPLLRVSTFFLHSDIPCSYGSTNVFFSQSNLIPFHFLMPFSIFPPLIFFSNK